MADMMKVYRALDSWAPFDTQMDFDNAGFLVGRAAADADRILVALDITEDVVGEAATWGAQLIVSHHPIIFHPLKSLTDGTPTGRILLRLAELGIGAICAHTNLDSAQGGVNDALAEKLGLKDRELLHQDGMDQYGRPYGIGRVGQVHEGGLNADQYAIFVKERLNAASVRYVDGGHPVNRIAVGGGSCGSMLSDVLSKGCDTFVTADIKYDVFLEAKAYGINLLDAGHYATENVVCPILAQFLAHQFPKAEVRISSCHREVYADA